MKKHFNNKKDHSNINDMMKVVNYYGGKLTVYNNIF